MRIEVEIPKEFEEHFKQDKFKDSLERIMADIKYSFQNGDYLYSKYEYETIEMLAEALENSKSAYDVDKVVDELEKRKQEYLDGFGIHQNNELYGVACGLGDAIEIVKQGGIRKDV